MGLAGKRARAGKLHRARAETLTRGRSLEVLVAELRKVRLEKPAQTATPGQEEIPQIVKETISALARKTSVADEYERKQRAKDMRALTESKGRVGSEEGTATRLGLKCTTLLSQMNSSE